jgi:hypothetical protein
MAASGCAIHYQNPQTGAEQLWGLGQLRLRVESAGGDGQLAAVSSGCRVPGLCLDVGRDHFGFTLGYLDRQRLVVVSSNLTAALQTPTNSVAGMLAREVNSLWAFGHLHMRTVGRMDRHQAIVTGKALAGFGAGLGGNDSSLSLALDTRQSAVVAGENVQVDFDQDASRWPGFNLFTAKVQATHSSESTLTEPKGEP